METAKAKKQRLIRLIHVGKTQLMMADSEYRTLLANISRGKTSSTKLSVDELELVVTALKARGFVVTTKAQAKVTSRILKSGLPILRLMAKLKKYVRYGLSYTVSVQ